MNSKLRLNTLMHQKKDDRNCFNVNHDKTIFEIFLYPISFRYFRCRMDHSDLRLLREINIHLDFYPPSSSTYLLINSGPCDVLTLFEIKCLLKNLRIILELRFPNLPFVQKTFYNFLNIKLTNS